MKKSENADKKSLLIFLINHMTTKEKTLMSESIQPPCTIHFSVIMMCVGCVSLTLFPLLELICLIYGDIKGRFSIIYELKNN